MSSQQPPSEPNEEGAAPGGGAAPPPTSGSGWSAGPPASSGAGWPPAAEGWAAPPPPLPGDGYAPPPQGTGYGQAPQYPPPGYPPQGYQAVGYPVQTQTDSKAIIGLVLAITSWIICPLLPAVAALIVAGQSSRAIDESDGRLEGRSMNTATKVIAWLNIALWAVGILVVVLLIIVGVSVDWTFIEDYADSSTQF